MPIKRCQKNNKPGFKFGDSGFCYTYTPGNKKEREAARKMAETQRKAIYSSGYRGKS